MAKTKEKKGTFMAKTKEKKGTFLCVTPCFFGGNGQKYEAGTIYQNVPDEISEYFTASDVEVEVEIETTEEELQG